MRRTELDKIDTLEDKIKLELQQLAERQTSMEKEMNEFGSVSGASGGAAAAGRFRMLQQLGEGCPSDL